MFVVEVATFARAISFGNFNDGKYRRFFSKPANHRSKWAASIANYQRRSHVCSIFLGFTSGFCKQISDGKQAMVSGSDFPKKTTLIELDDGKIYRKDLYLIVKTMVSCRFSLKPIH